MSPRDVVSRDSSSGTPSSNSLSKGTGDLFPPPLDKYDLDRGGDGADSEPYNNINGSFEIEDIINVIISSHAISADVKIGSCSMNTQSVHSMCVSSRSNK